jgi:hypothetical protein
MQLAPPAPPASPLDTHPDPHGVPLGRATLLYGLFPLAGVVPNFVAVAGDPPDRAPPPLPTTQLLYYRRPALQILGTAAVAWPGWG